MTYIICRYGEISLKGRNQHLFEKQLIRNMEKSLKKEKIDYKLKRIRRRIIVSSGDAEKAAESLRNVFGLTSVSIAHKTEIDFKKISELALSIVKDKTFSTFRVTANRCQKVLMPSMEIEKQLGAIINEKFDKKVSLKKFDLEVSVELSDYAYVFTEKIPCFGGLPVGVEGTILALIDMPLEGELNYQASLLASWFMLKRGCHIIPVSFDNNSKVNLIDLLNQFGCESEITQVENMEELEELAKQRKCKAIVVGQTLESFEMIKTKLPVLRPLISFTDSQIKDKISELT